MASSPESPRREPGLVDALCLPPNSCAGWIGPVLFCISIADALVLERTSKPWRSWLLQAEDVWEQLASASGVAIACRGPLARYFTIASWRRVCVECLGELSRELRGEAPPLGDGALAPGDLVALADGAVGEVLGDAPGSRDGERVYSVRVGAHRTNQTAVRRDRCTPLRRHGEQWWRAAAALDVEDAAARDFVAGVAGRHWRGEPGGVFTFGAARATPIHYRRTGGRWVWSPDRVNWMACTEVAPQGARWRAQSLVEANRQIARFLEARDPTPRPWNLEPTVAELSLAPRARPPDRRADDVAAARSAARAASPDAHGGILGLANTHVHVVHDAFAPPAHILHVDPATIQNHAGGWLHSHDGGATWRDGLGPAAANVRSRDLDEEEGH